MPTLFELQRQFFGGIFDSDLAIVNALLPSDTLTAHERLNIYRGSVFGLYTQALADIYPVCKRLLGAQFFDAMCDRYIVKYRSTSQNLQNYGASFAVFLRDFEPVAHLQYLPDVATLEWAWHRAFNARDESQLDVQSLSTLDEERMSDVVFRLPADAALLFSDYPVDQIWLANQADVEQPPLIDADAGGVYLFIWRQEYKVCIERLNADQWAFLQAINRSSRLLDISEAHPQLDLTRLLPEAMANRWLADYR